MLCLKWEQPGCFRLGLGGHGGFQKTIWVVYTNPVLETRNLKNNWRAAVFKHPILLSIYLGDWTTGQSLLPSDPANQNATGFVGRAPDDKTKAHDRSGGTIYVDPGITIFPRMNGYGALGFIATLKPSESGGAEHDKHAYGRSGDEMPPPPPVAIRRGSRCYQREKNIRRVWEDLERRNSWGSINLAREGIRFFQDINKPQGERLWSVASGAGLLLIPAVVFYRASKFSTPELIFQRLDCDLFFYSADEGITSTLTAEIDPKWNLGVRLFPALAAIADLTPRYRSPPSNMVDSERGLRPQNR